ncbi:hypothetical protein C8Q79DRAFT_1008617 [Trametes meyenii]|nr:hypothetical protein C8Q79DRAFT_1008617 [Trametes meyenii]
MAEQDAPSVYLADVPAESTITFHDGEPFLPGRETLQLGRASRKREIIAGTFSTFGSLSANTPHGSESPSNEDYISSPTAGDEILLYPIDESTYEPSGASFAALTLYGYFAMTTPSACEKNGPCGIRPRGASLSHRPPGVYPPPHVGYLYLHESSNGGRQTWIFGYLGEWVPVELGHPHPFLQGYLLHFCGNGEPSWITRKTFASYRAALKRRK